MAALSQEATLINLNFSQMLLQKVEEKKMANPNPFEEPGTRSTTMAYRYRKFSMDGTEIIVRTELDTFTTIAGKEQYVKLCALNEFDPRLSGSVDWRRKLDTQNGAVLAAELKNNSNKLAQWTAKAFMSGSDHMRMGFVSRQHPKDCYQHSVLQVQTNTTESFARQINLDMHNCWGILKGYVDLLGRQEPGKYVLLKDPNKPLVRIYNVPMDAFDVREEVVEEGEMEEMDFDEDFQ